MLYLLYSIYILIVFLINDLSCNNEKYRYRLFNGNNLAELNKNSLTFCPNVWLRLNSINNPKYSLWLHLELKKQNQFPILVRKNENKVDWIQTDTQSHKCLYSATSNLIPYSNEFSSMTTTERIEKEIKFVSNIADIDEHKNHFSVSLCNGISGIEKLYNSSKYIYFNSKKHENTTNVQVLSSSESESVPPRTADNLYQQLYNAADWKFSQHQRSKRSAFHMPVKEMPGPYLVELYIIVDSKMAAMFGGDNYNNLFSRISFIMNQINLAFSQFNIYFTVIQLEIWERDQIKLTDENHILMELQLYKRRFINKRHDCLHAILGENLGTARRGQSEMASMCGYNRCVGYTKDYYSQNEIDISHAVLHEIGHNFGLHHDTEQCKCYGCIMATGIESGSFSFNWSNCSKHEIKSLLKSGMADCLLDEPPSNMGKMNAVAMEPNGAPRNIESLMPSKCGNGVVDKGEQCDCGGRKQCEAESNKCCNPETCLFTVGASCAGGSCCDLQRCSLKKSGTICRNIELESCDLPEYCNGESEWCPSDVYKQDGISCSNKITGEYSHCYRGKCASRRHRCQKLWGDTAEVSNDVCYDMNKRGDLVANCGLEIPREADRDRQPKNWNTKPCSKETSICGRLWCRHENERVLRLSEQFLNDEIVNGYHCSAVRFDMDWYLDDFGMVPNGVSCGSGRICWKSECVLVNSIEQNRCNCHEHGDCNNRGNCHCHPGFSAPNCTTNGDGGSIDSGPPPKFNHQSRLIITVILIVMIVILTIFVILVFIYHYRNRTWPYFVSFIKCPNYKFRRSKLLILCHKCIGKGHPKSSEIRNNESNVTLLSELRSIEGGSPDHLATVEIINAKNIEIRKVEKDNSQYSKPKRPVVINIDAKYISNESNKPLYSPKSPKSPDRTFPVPMSVKEKAKYLENTKEKLDFENHKCNEKVAIEKKPLKTHNFIKPEILSEKPTKNSNKTLNTVKPPILSAKPQKSVQSAKSPPVLGAKPQKPPAISPGPPITTEKPKKISNLEINSHETKSIPHKSVAIAPNIQENKSITEQPRGQNESLINKINKSKYTGKSVKPFKFQISEPTLDHSTNALASPTCQPFKPAREKGPDILSHIKPPKTEGDIKVFTNSKDEQNNIKLARPLKFQISQPRLEQTTCTDATQDLPVVDKTLTRTVAPHKVFKNDPSKAVNFRN